MIKKVGKYVFLCIASFLSIFPFLWMIVGATNASVDITSGRDDSGESASYQYSYAVYHYKHRDGNQEFHDYHGNRHDTHCAGSRHGRIRI